MEQMMSIQKNILSRYRQFFPEETLREVSSRTGIQITRVFRLFNGKTMKVAELEAFEAAISLKIAENPSYARLSSLLEKSSALLTNDELTKVGDYIDRKLAAKNFGRMYISQTHHAAIIA
jgi:hypothetical protein